MKATSNRNAGPRTRSAILWWVAALVLVVVCAAAYVAFERYAAAHTITKTSEESLIVPTVGPTDNVLGPSDAPVELIVYADLSCQYCNLFFLQTMPKLQQEFGDKIVVVYRNLPLPTHPNSLQEAYAAQCVSQVGTNSDFWKFIEAALGSPGYLSGLDLTTLTSIALRSGVPEAKFAACMNSGASKEAVDQQTLQASIAGLTETPSTVFKSSTRALIVQGDYPSQYVAAIRYLLTNDASSSPQY